jgi:hypothetical protein
LYNPYWKNYSNVRLGIEELANKKHVENHKKVNGRKKPKY